MKFTWSETCPKINGHFWAREKSSTKFGFYWLNNYGSVEKPNWRCFDQDGFREVPVDSLYWTNEPIPAPNSAIANAEIEILTLSNRQLLEKCLSGRNRVLEMILLEKLRGVGFLAD